MARTPKPIRKAIKRARNHTANYFGLKVRATVKRGKRSTTETFIDKKGKKRSLVAIDGRLYLVGVTKGIPNLKRISVDARHEFAHATIAQHLLVVRKGNTFLIEPYFSEAMAMLAEFDTISKGRAPREKKNLENMRMLKSIVESPKTAKVHEVGAYIALNIIKSFPNRKQRKKYVRGLMARNKRILSGLKKGDHYIISHLGEIIKKPPNNTADKA